MTSSRNNGILLTVISVILLTACSTTSYNPQEIPEYPLAGPRVGQELSDKCGGRTLPECPWTYLWLKRLDKWKTQIEVYNDE